MKIKPTRKVPLGRAARFEAQAQATEQQFVGNDSRVIVRQRDVLQYELAAIEEHVVGLRASLTEVLAKKERIEARVDGLTRVLQRR